MASSVSKLMLSVSHALMFVLVLMISTCTASSIDVGDTSASRTVRHVSHRHRCNCIPYQQCISLLAHRRNVNPKRIRILKAPKCGREDGPPEVCCPVNTFHGSSSPNPTAAPQVSIAQLPPYPTNHFQHSPNLSDHRQSGRPKLSSPSVIQFPQPEDSSNLHASDMRPSTDSFRPRTLQPPTQHVEGVKSGSVQLPIPCGQGGQTTRIHGGEEAEFGEFPWMALLGYVEVSVSGHIFMCGGSVITNRYILTAAHCNDARLLGNRTLDIVRLGEHMLSTPIDCMNLKNGQTLCNLPHQDFGIEEFLSHSLYNKDSRATCDVALVRVNREIEFTIRIQPVCLPPPEFNIANYEKTFLVVAGWGASDMKETHSDSLQYVRVPFVDLDTCNISFTGQLVDSQICAGGTSGPDACKGDSGGPLLRQESVLGPPYYQVGIVSFGSSNCGLRDLPGVYTSVLAFRDWIIGNLRP